MRVYKEPVELNFWASRVTVSRTREGRWCIKRDQHYTELPASAFDSWDHAQWTGNAWANEEYEASRQVTE